MFIDDVDRGLKCNCKCIECGEDMIANHGEINQHYFDHANGNVFCKGGQETALHQFAKQIIVDNSQISIPKFGTINYTESIAEKEFISYRPDVTAIYNGQKTFFEIAVTHFNEPNKDDFFIDGQFKSIEINLGEIKNNWTPEIVKEIVLKQTDNKRIIFWEPVPVIVYQVQDDNKPWWKHPAAICGYILAGIFLLYKGYKCLTKKTQLKKHKQG